MGDVISIEEHRRARAFGAAPRSAARARPRRRLPATLWFDLRAPSTYLVAERAERLLPGARWCPALPAVPAADPEAALQAAASRAAELRLPFVWPEGDATPGRGAARAAAFAAERGRAAAFVLAASRLRFCGGFDLDDPDVIAEAAAAAALPLDDCLAAAGDPLRDVSLEGAGRALLARGAVELPVVGVGALLFCGEQRLGEAAAAHGVPQGNAEPVDLWTG